MDLDLVDISRLVNLALAITSLVLWLLIVLKPKEK